MWYFDGRWCRMVVSTFRYARGGKPDFRNVWRFPLSASPRSAWTPKQQNLHSHVAAARLTSLPSSDLLRPRDWTNRYMEENLMTALPADTFSNFGSLELL